MAAFAQAGGEAIEASHARVALVAQYALPLCLLALAGTVPLIFLRPLAAAVFITVASLLSLAAFGLLTEGNTASGVMAAGLMTAGGVAAQVIAVYRLGAAGPGDSAGAAGQAGWQYWQFLALVLAAPFLVLALASRGGTAGSDSVNVWRGHQPARHSHRRFTHTTLTWSWP